jgi:methylated-DNA-protein-cysteine methyltransferase-like protein
VTDFSQKVYACVLRIPKGRIINYGGVAALVGKPRAARGVGYALSHLPAGTDVPWWRVVNRRGGISTSHFTGTAQIQKAILESEGVEFDDAECASWERFGWDPYES